MAGVVSSLFISSTALFGEKFLEASLEIGVVSLAMQSNIKTRIYKRIEDTIGPIIEEYFVNSINDTNMIMDKNISKLVTRHDIPFKYNKDLLMTFNDEKSIFAGYYDDVVKDAFSKKEIDLLKRTILTGKYSGQTDRELATAISNAVKTTKSRALNIARQETARLNSAAVDIYFADPAVKALYNKVFRTAQDDRVRPTHRSYDGKIADKDGYFDGDCGKITGAPVACSPWNCRCYTELVKK